MSTTITRRDALIGLAGLGAAAGVTTLGVPGVAQAATQGERLRALHAALTPAQRNTLFLPWDHPSRQLVNTVAILRKPHIGTVLNAQQLPHVWGLWESMFSVDGAARMREPLRAEGGGLVGCVFVGYGDPHQGPCQAVISGGHLQVRGGDIPNGGFGDGVSYGHQVGNEQLRIPGNVWAFHSDAANVLFSSLNSAQRRVAMIDNPPYELTVQVQGEQGRFTGLSGQALDDEQRELLQRLLKDVLSAYPAVQVAQALADIEALGGLASLHVTYYAKHAYYDDGTSLAEGGWRESALPYCQVWRIEGPGTVIHFQGDPHVHAYVHVTADPAKQNVGATLAELQRPLEEREIRRFMEQTMRAVGGADLAVLAELTGRVPAGRVTSGLLWSLDPFGNRLHVVELTGAQLAPPLRERLQNVEPQRVYRVVSPDYYLDAFGEQVGTWQSRTDTGVVLRDALVAAVQQDPRLLTG